MPQSMRILHNLLVLIDDHKASGNAYIRWCLADDESMQPEKMVITKFVETGSSFNIQTLNVGALAPAELN